MLIDTSLLWAKSPPGDACLSTGYPLVPHLLDVAAVGRVLISSVPCPVTPCMSKAWITALVGLHDLGKASPGFQRKLGRKEIGSTPIEQDQPDRHDISTVQILHKLLKGKGVSHTEASDLAQAVGAHHGSPFTAAELQKRWEITDPWHMAHCVVMSMVLEGVGATDLPALPKDAAERSVLLQWMMGLTTVADWLGSSEALCRWERLQQHPLNPTEWFTDSLDLARKAVQTAELASFPLPQPANGEAAVRIALGHDRKPRPLQETIAEVIDNLPSGAGLILIEAPMGEGKTEAALSCALGTRGVYLAMPTQATSNALFRRLTEFLAATPFPDGSRPPIALSHAYGGPDAAALRLREIGLGTDDSNVSAGWWFRGGKRSLLCPHGIGTVDQGLLGVLECRHSFLRLYGLAGRTVIFDEVHAYDNYTSGLIERLISWLKVLGCRVIVMSATLPQQRLQALVAAWSGGENLAEGGSDRSFPAAPYPRITWLGSSGVMTKSFAPSRQQRVLFLKHPSDVESMAAQAAAWAAMGARVLVVVNKVARAQDLYRRLGSGIATLFHARFPMKQRLEIERRVLDAFGPGGVARGGHVLVATQVAEQSLDIDFDVLLSDPAPVDLLLQREGRIHRHTRKRPEAFTIPQVFVADLHQILPKEELTSFIYDRWLVLRSTAWLRENPILQLPADIDRAVQAVYGEWQPQGPDELRTALQECKEEHETTWRNQCSQARQAAIESPGDWSFASQSGKPVDDTAAEDGRIRFGTRLGRDSESVIPVSPADKDQWEVRRHELGNWHMRISDPRLIQVARAAQLPSGWRDNPALRAHRPLFLDASGRVVDAPVSARLDPDLGLVVGETA
jgi:CRISPR-associated endonuclease/helicase Cas3